MKKITNLADHKQAAIEANARVLQSTDSMIEWFVDPSKLFDIYEEDLVQSRYEAIPIALSTNIDRIRSAIWPVSHAAQIQHMLDSLEQIHAIMIQCRQIEDNEQLPDQLQESLRNECAAAIEVIWRRVTGIRSV